MAGLTIDQFLNVPSTDILDTDYLPVGRGDTTYHDLYPELIRYIQRKQDLSPNNLLSPQIRVANGGFIATVAGGALTVSLKTFNGSDPSTGDPVYLIFRSGTMANGGYVISKVTAPVAYTIGVGNTLGISVNQPNTELLILVLYDPTAPQIGLVNPKLANGTLFIPDEWSLKSTTGGAGGNNAGIIYSATSLTNRAASVAGFIRWNAGLATAGTWTAPDAVVAINPGSSLARMNEVSNGLLTSMGLLAPLASPALTGTPTAPNAAANTNTTQVATTAFVLGQGASATPLMDGTAVIGTSTRFAREDHIHPTDTSRAPTVSPTFTGTPVAPTALQDTNTTQVATTAYVLAQASAVVPSMDGAGAVGTSLRYARADHVHPSDTSKAGLASPTFTGTPASTTAATDTNTTQIATTAFVLGQASSVNPSMDGAAAVGTSLRFARADHVHPSDTSRAPTTSPSFTGTAVFTNPGAPTVHVLSGTNASYSLFGVGRASREYEEAVVSTGNQFFSGTGAGDVILRLLLTTGKIHIGVDNGAGTATAVMQVTGSGVTLNGTPLAVTAAVDTSTTQLATTAFVINQGYLKASVAASTYAPLASPTFTGAPKAPTPIAGTNDGTLATTAFVNSSVSAAGNYNPSAVVITGGSINGTTIGSITPSTGVFTSLICTPPLADDNSTRVPTTGWFLGQAATANPNMDGVASAGTAARWARSDHIHPSDTSRAGLASPTFTGTPSGPTATQDTNTTQFATTAFVLSQASSVSPAMDGSAAVGTSLRFARADHIHPSDTSRAPLASPGLTGTPTAPTAVAGTNTTQIATTAFVLAQGFITAASIPSSYGSNPAMDGTASAGVSTQWARGDHVHPIDTSRAPNASPSFTGTPTAPTAGSDTNTGQLATTGFVIGQASAVNPSMDGSAAVGTSLRYARADHVHPSDTTRAPIFPVGQCELIFTSTSVLTLRRKRGSYIFINGNLQQVPSGGITLSSGGLTNNTLYYIYVFMNGSTMTLEASTTGYTVDGTSGLEVKSTDASRTLVGMTYVTPAATFVSDYTRSRWNRTPILQSKMLSAAITTGTTDTEMITTRCFFVPWADEILSIKVTGSGNIGSVDANAYAYACLDGTAGGVFFEITQHTGWWTGFHAVYPAIKNLSETLHYGSCLTHCDSGWIFNNSSIITEVMSVLPSG